jgi:hypothetical protein
MRSSIDQQHLHRLTGLAQPLRGRPECNINRIRVLLVAAQRHHRGAGAGGESAQRAGLQRGV